MVDLLLIGLIAAIAAWIISARRKLRLSSAAFPIVPRRDDPPIHRRGVVEVRKAVRIGLIEYVRSRYPEWSRRLAALSPIVSLRQFSRGGRRPVRLATIAALAAGVICFGYFVWPTPYRHVSMPPALRTANSYSCCYVARANRFTGDVEVLGADGWLSWSSLMSDTTMRREMSDTRAR